MPPVDGKSDLSLSVSADRCCLLLCALLLSLNATEAALHSTVLRKK